MRTGRASRGSFATRCARRLRRGGPSVARGDPCSRVLGLAAPGAPSGPGPARYRARDSPPTRAGATPHGRRARVARPLFATTSFWNRRLAGRRPRSIRTRQRLVQALVAEVQRERARRHRAVDRDGLRQHAGLPGRRPGQARVRVRLDTAAPSTAGSALQRALASVPIPRDAKPAPGSDRHMTIWQASTDTLWELFGARRDADGWHARWGGAIRHVSTQPRLLHGVRVAGRHAQLGRHRQQPAGGRRHDPARRAAAPGASTTRWRSTCRRRAPASSRGPPSAPTAPARHRRCPRARVCASIPALDVSACTCPS